MSCNKPYGHIVVGSWGDYEDAAFALISMMKAIVLLQRVFVHTVMHTYIGNNMFIVLVNMYKQHATWQHATTSQSGISRII